MGAVTAELVDDISVEVVLAMTDTVLSTIANKVVYVLVSVHVLERNVSTTTGEGLCTVTRRPGQFGGCSSRRGKYGPSSWRSLLSFGIVVYMLYM
jgi:hypothetical protein